MKDQSKPLNPLFADIPMWELISRLEAHCVFKSEELETELSARLERVGLQWRFVRLARIEIYSATKHGYSDERGELLGAD